MDEEKSGVPDFSIHDFRHTARTHLAALSVNLAMAERCLNQHIKEAKGVHDCGPVNNWNNEESGGMLLTTGLMCWFT